MFAEHRTVSTRNGHFSTHAGRRHARNPVKGARGQGEGLKQGEVEADESFGNLSFMKKYFEFNPGLDTLRYLLSFGFLELLGRRIAKRPQRFFVGGSSSMDRHILTEGYFEKGVLDLIRDLCTKSGHTSLLIDIGANVGNHSIGLASTFKQVESVEPHPVLFKILEANILQNQMSHVHAHNVGLAGEDSRGTLTESANEHGISRVKERSKLPPEVFGLSADKFGTEFSVELRSAEDFVGGYGNSLNQSFIKIDVEGMEQEIVTGLLPLLKKFKPIVGFEWFTRAQPDMFDIGNSVEGYELWGIRVHDQGSSRLARAFKLLFTGRFYTLEKLVKGQLDEVYPLALMVPKEVVGNAGL
jgi:FkbM family methyltransferase